MFAALLVVLIVTAVFHYLNGGIRLQSPFQRVTPQVKVHLSVILALMALTKTVQYYLARFELDVLAPRRRRRRELHRREGAAPGAQPADVHLDRGRGACSSRTSSAGVGCSRSSRSGCGGSSRSWSARSIPASSSGSSVQPNEFTREEPYIKRNIDGDARRVRARRKIVRRKAFDYDDRPRRTADVEREQRDARQRPALGPEPIAARRSSSRRSSSRSTSSPTSTSTATTIGGETRQPTLIARARARPDAPPEQHVDEPAPRVHARLRRRSRRRPTSRTTATARLPRSRTSRRQASCRARPDQPGVYFGEDLGGYVVVDTQGRRARAATASGQTKHDAVQGQRRCEGVELRCARPRSRCASAT